MKQIKNKLKSESGVSILFALLLMLVVAMVSVVMVNASLTAVKRTSAKKDNQQISISLDSAALLLRDRISRNSEYQLIVDEKGNYTDVSNATTNTFEPEITEISVTYGNQIKNGLTKVPNGTFRIITKVNNGIEDTVVVNYSLINADKTDTTNGKAVFKLESRDSLLYLTFSLSLNQETNVVSWVYNGTSLEAGQ